MLAKWISVRHLILGSALIALHFALWAFVVWRPVLYDEGGLIGLSWWIVWFYVLPVVSLGVFARGAYLAYMNREDEWEE